MTRLPRRQIRQLLRRFQEIDETGGRPVKVSVSITTYNHGEFIARALDSALMQQTDFDFEIVVGEDCSTDRTRAIVLDYQRRYPECIRLLLSEENLGRYTKNGRLNLMRNLAACRGEYVALLEGDDYWTNPQKLRRQANCLTTHPAYSVCFHPIRVVDEQNRETDYPFPQVAVKDTYEMADLCHGNFIHTGSMLFRRSALGKMPGWLVQPPMGDWPLLIHLARRGLIGRLPEPMGAYRIHPSGYWSQIGEFQNHQRTLEAVGVIRKHLPRRYRRLFRQVTIWTHYHLAILSEAQQQNTQAGRHAFAAFCLSLLPPSLAEYRPLRVNLWECQYRLIWRLGDLGDNPAAARSAFRALVMSMVAPQSCARSPFSMSKILFRYYFPQIWRWHVKLGKNGS